MKKILLFLMTGLFFSFASMAAENASGFPFLFEMDAEPIEKLCYAGHITGGGLFYDDGLMVKADSNFRVRDRLGEVTEAYENLSVEVDLIYENNDNTVCVKETLKKYDYGDITPDKQYPLFSETMIKNLRQRKKLYSSDVMSIKISMSYRGQGTATKKQTKLFYVAKDAEYQEKLIALEAPPEE